MFLSFYPFLIPLSINLLVLFVYIVNISLTIIIIISPIVVNNF